MNSCVYSSKQKKKKNFFYFSLFLKLLSQLLLSLAKEMAEICKRRIFRWIDYNSLWKPKKASINPIFFIISSIKSIFASPYASQTTTNNIISKSISRKIAITPSFYIFFYLIQIKNFISYFFLAIFLSLPFIIFFYYDWWMTHILARSKIQECIFFLNPIVNSFSKNF